MQVCCMYVIYSITSTHSPTPVTGPDYSWAYNIMDTLSHLSPAPTHLPPGSTCNLPIFWLTWPLSWTALSFFNYSINLIIYVEKLDIKVKVQSTARHQDQSTINNLSKVKVRLQGHWSDDFQAYLSQSRSDIKTNVHWTTRSAYPRSMSFSQLPGIYVPSLRSDYKIKGRLILAICWAVYEF